MSEAFPRERTSGGRLPGNRNRVRSRRNALQPLYLSLSGGACPGDIWTDQQDL